MPSFLPDTQIELIHEQINRGHLRYALFDFDGTISLIREGWQQVMNPMMVDLLMQTPEHESRAELERVVEEFVSHLTGKQTIYQMLQLCEEIRLRGGTPKEALEYKHDYLRLLQARIQSRVEGLQNGSLTIEDLTVPGALDFLNALKARGVRCYLASGTDEIYVKQESGLLGLHSYFDGIYGALDNYQNFSKKMVIERIIRENNLRGEELVAFGDGYVEIEDTKSHGGIAVGVATDEVHRRGVDQWKRTRLIEAGADLIIPDFRETPALIQYLFMED
ncbi:MAG: HAD family hydrolase [Anaerolineaceae bacterium]|nr:HAD family hydrolase [Anaerolineaceae bacterium]